MRIARVASRALHFVFSRPNFLGLASGAVWLCFSLTPSLLPRPSVMQGFITGMSFAVGYGVGVLISWVVRKVFRWHPSKQVRQYTWVGLAVLGPVGVGITVTLYFVRWQNEVRALIDEPPLESGHRVLIFVIAVIVASLLILLSRLIFWLIRFTDRTLVRYIPHRLSGAAAFVIVTAFLYLLVSGVGYHLFVHWANTVYRGVNDSTPAGVAQPTSPYKSGSKDSLIAWQSLGKQGRRFTGSGPTPTQLFDFSGQQPVEPIRIYAGLDSAGSAKERAQLALQELDRTHAFERPVLVVITPTGTGWVNPQTVDALEYMYNGDTAMVAIQYSYLPSWISFLVDRDNATAAGRELFNQVYDRWSQLPPDHRPKLIAYGLSLGSYGMQAAFSGEDDLKNRTDGALFVGTPNNTPLWQDLERNRDQGSPAWQPQYHSGRTIRFAAQGSDMAQPADPWPYPRVIYLQHASDPTVWWSTDLLLQQPAWLKESPGRDVTNNMHWFPLSTFLGVTVDQFMGVSVPDDHGHNYNTAPVDAWTALVPPPGWDVMKTNHLRSLVAAYPDR